MVYLGVPLKILLKDEFFLEFLQIGVKVHLFVKKSNPKPVQNQHLDWMPKNHFEINQLSFQKAAFVCQKPAFGYQKVVFRKINQLIQRKFWASDPKVGFGQVLDYFFSTKRCTFKEH